MTLILIKRGPWTSASATKISTCVFWENPLYQSNHNINGVQCTYVRKYTMVWFDFKIKKRVALFLDTWWFYLQQICLPTNTSVLAMQGGCVGVIYITVKHKIIAGLSIQVVTNIGCTVLGHIHCVRQTWCIGGIHSHLTGFKIPLIATSLRWSDIVRSKPKLIWHGLTLFGNTQQAGSKILDLKP